MIIKNHEFYEVREFLKQHEETKDRIIMDLNKEHHDAEVARMKKFGEEKLRAQVFVLD